MPQTSIPDPYSKEERDKLYSLGYEWIEKREFEIKELQIHEEGAEVDPYEYFIHVSQYLWELCMFRMRDLYRGYSQAFLERNLPSQALNARGMLETMCVSTYEIKELERIGNFEGNGVKPSASDWDLLKEKVGKILFGSRGAEKGELPDSISILTCIEAADKYYNGLKLLEGNRLTQLYGDLSNVAHPNFDGMMKLYDKNSTDEDKHYLQYSIDTCISTVLALSRAKDRHINIELPKSLSQQSL